MENVLTVEEVAKLLKVKPITVREMLREQRIRGFKVGKAWRTTETMLQEDLETIAQGAKPEPLEAQRVLAAMPKRVRRGRKPAEGKAAELKENAAPAKASAMPPKENAVPAKPKAVAKTEAPAKASADANDEAPAKPSRRGAKGSDKPEDQQLLF